MADLDLDLSAMVTEDIGAWSFEDLHQRAGDLIERAPTAIERGQARLLLNKIDRFAELKERHDTIEQVRYETQRRDRRLGRADMVRHEASLGPRFDGVGRLAPVALRRGRSAALCVARLGRSNRDVCLAGAEHQSPLVRG